MKQFNTKEYTIMQNVLFLKGRIASDQVALQQLMTLQGEGPAPPGRQELPGRQVVRNIMAYARAMDVVSYGNGKNCFIIKN